MKTVFQGPVSSSYKIPPRPPYIKLMKRLPVSLLVFLVDRHILNPYYAFIKPLTPELMNEYSTKKWWSWPWASITQFLNKSQMIKHREEIDWEWTSTKHTFEDFDDDDVDIIAPFICWRLFFQNEKADLNRFVKYSAHFDDQAWKSISMHQRIDDAFAVKYVDWISWYRFFEDNTNHCVSDGMITELKLKGMIDG